MPDLPLDPGTLADPDCWPASPQTLYDEMFAKGSATMPDITGILIQDAAPDPIYRGNKGWLPTSGGVPIYPGYIFIWHATVGHWVSRHYKGASDPRPEPYFDNIANLATFDGGDAGAPGIASGPMWEVWTAVEGRTLVGAGTVPTSSPAVTIANLATADSTGAIGEYKHSLVPDEMQHMHGCGEDPVNLVGGNVDDPAVQLHRDWTTLPETYVTGRQDMSGTSGTGYVDSAAIGTGAFATTKAVTDPDFPTVDGHNNMMPYLGINWIKRTARQFYVLG